jgi:hypothetical protein
MLLLSRLLFGVDARTVLTFDYNWKFHLGDPAGVQPPLTAASVDSSFTGNVSGMDCTCMAYAARRPVLGDCRGICATTPGCLAWQYGGHFDVKANPNFNSCFIHDPQLGSPPVCTKMAPNATVPMVGGSRPSVPPPIQQRTGVAFKESAFDDSGWDAVDAPHDFIVRGTYTEEASLKHGFLPRNVSGWYRKEFNLPAEWAGGATWLHFEGVFQSCDVFLNGQFLLRHTAGYLGFDAPLDSGTPGLLRMGGGGKPNVLAVRVDASFGSGHWYEGGGLVRPVHLLHTPTRMRFATNGLVAQTAASSVPATAGAGVIVVPSAEVLADAPTSARVCYSVVDRLTDSTVATSCTPAAAIAPSGPAPAGGSIRAPEAAAPAPAAATPPTVVRGASLSIAAARLWSVRSPTRYTLTAALIDASPAGANATVDTLNISVGFRNITWEAPGGGFALNNEPLHLRGFSHHQVPGACRETCRAVHTCPRPADHRPRTTLSHSTELTPNRPPTARVVARRRQDFGAVGMAVPDRVNLFKANALRSVGGNIWRTSHNVSV